MAKRIVEYVEAVKVAPVSKDAEDVKFIQDVLTGLKANPGKDVKLDIEAKTRVEAEKIVRKLMKLKKGMGLAFKNLVFEVCAEGENGFVTKARLEKPARKSGKRRKKKSKASPAVTQAEPAGFAQYKPLIDKINSGGFPNDVLRGMLTQYTDAAAGAQKLLETPDKPEQEKETLKNGIEINRLIAEAIKKKLG
jgi:hypothetical protein